MRVGVVDLGSNSTRLLVADVEDGRVTAEVARESRVTRLGHAVDATGALDPAAVARTLAVLDDYRVRLDAAGAERVVGVLTSAVRDAADGPAFTATVRDRYAIDARTISGAEEARLTFAGATSERPRDPDGPELAVLDIGGGSTEVVTGRPGGGVAFFASLQAGVVRQTERHVAGDPPAPHEVEAIRRETAGLLAAEVPAAVRARIAHLVGVAGTPTSAAAMELGLEPYDARRTHGRTLSAATLEDQLARLAALPEDERRRTRGLHPDRAPTIVAGLAMLLACLEAFATDRIEVSEHDILRGAALGAAAR